MALPPASQLEPGVLDALPLSVRRELERAYGIGVGFRAMPFKSPPKRRRGGGAGLGLVGRAGGRRQRQLPPTFASPPKPAGAGAAGVTLTQVDPAVLAELPEDLRAEIAAALPATGAAAHARLRRAGLRPGSGARRGRQQGTGSGSGLGSWVPGVGGRAGPARVRRPPDATEDARAVWAALAAALDDLLLTRQGFSIAGGEGEEGAGQPTGSSAGVGPERAASGPVPSSEQASPHSSGSPSSHLASPAGTRSDGQGGLRALQSGQDGSALLERSVSGAGARSTSPGANPGGGPMELRQDELGGAAGESDTSLVASSPDSDAGSGLTERRLDELGEAAAEYGASLVPGDLEGAQLLLRRLAGASARWPRFAARAFAAAARIQAAARQQLGAPLALPAPLD